MAAYTNRFEALRAKARLFNDPTFTAKLLAGDVATRDQFAELTKYLHETGGVATGKELAIGEFSVPEV